MNIEITNSQKKAFIDLCNMRLNQITNTIAELSGEIYSINDILDQLNAPPEESEESKEILDSEESKGNLDLKYAVIQNGIDKNSVKEGKVKPKKDIIKRQLPLADLQKEANERHKGDNRTFPRRQEKAKTSKEFFEGLDEHGNFNKIKKEDRPPANYSNNKSLYPELNEPNSSSF